MRPRAAVASSMRLPSFFKRRSVRGNHNKRHRAHDHEIRDAPPRAAVLGGGEPRAQRQRESGRQPKPGGRAALRATGSLVSPARRFWSVSDAPSLCNACQASACEVGRKWRGCVRWSRNREEEQALEGGTCDWPQDIPAPGFRPSAAVPSQPPNPRCAGQTNRASLLLRGFQLCPSRLPHAS